MCLQALGAVLNLSAGAQAVRCALLEAGLLSHLWLILHTIVRERKDAGSSSVICLPPEAAHMALGAISNLLAHNKDAKHDLLLRCDGCPHLLLQMLEQTTDPSCVPQREYCLLGAWASKGVVRNPAGAAQEKDEEERAIPEAELCNTLRCVRECQTRVWV